ncbi:retrovirus-related pol polyprotein from transposon TNT 1-94 [Tanacetum coccineum]
MGAPEGGSTREEPLQEAGLPLPLERNYYSEDQYAVSIKEDTVYPCLHSPKTTKGMKINTPYPEDSIRDLDNSTNNVLIPLDSWTSRLLVYRLPLSGSSKKAKIVESKNANHSEPNHTWGSNATDIPSSSSLVMTGCPDCSLVNRLSSGYTTVEGLVHNLFSVGQFCDGDLEVAFQKNTCFIRNLEGVDLLSGSRDTNLYTISLDDMLKTSPICLLSKASKTKSWLWHRRLSHLNLGTINKLARDGLARGTSRLKFQKDHLCSACAVGKRKKSSHQPKAEDTNQENLYLFHIDLCGPMRVASINGKRYILVIVDDYSRFTWATAKKAFRIYNKRTQKIIETIHVTFDELTAMASEQFSSGLGLQCMTPATSSSGLVLNPVSQQPCIPPNRDDCKTVSTYDLPSSSTPSTQEREQSTNISQGFEESLKTPLFRNDPLNESPHEESTSQGSSSNVRQSHTLFEHLAKWTKNHPIANVISDPSRSVSTRKQLQTDAMWCYFDAFLTSVVPKNFKQAMTELSWIDAMQEEIHEFQRLEV